LLYEIQKVVGGAKVFEPFMPAYFTHFRFKSLGTDDFKVFLYKWFTEKYGEEMKTKLDEIDWKTWLYGKGMPPVTPKFDMTLATPAYSLAKRWAEASSKDINPIDLPFQASDLKGWFAGQICTPQLSWLC
jgi:leukotriene-A4 hydrolase